MKADSYALSTIFGKDVRYEVPLFQRPYVWEQEKHWEPFIEDVLRTADDEMEASARGNGERRAPHFMGAIVLDQMPTQLGQIETRQVIDGQQRLTTLQLFVAAAARVVGELGHEKAARVLRRLVANDQDLAATMEDQFKVWPTNSNREAFEAVMQPDGPAPGRKDDPSNLIDEAFAYFSSEVREWLTDEADEDEITRRVAALQNVVRERIHVVVIDLDPEDDAQVIFETLNAGGQPLLAVDLVKNHVFQLARRLDVDLHALYEHQWAPFESDYWQKQIKQGRLKRARSEMYLMHWLTMKTREDVKADQMFGAFRRFVRDSSESVIDIVEEFAADARVYAGFDALPDGSAEAHFFHSMSVLDMSVAHPLALWLLRRPEGRLLEEQRASVFQMLDSYFVRRMICGLTTKNYNRIICQLIDAVEASAEVESAIAEKLLVESDSVRWPSDDEVRMALTAKPLYKRVAQARVEMLLRNVELAMHDARTEPLSIDGKLTIEHIMPQKWESHWPLPDDQEPLAARQERDQRINRLGNLTLVTHSLNATLSHAPWAQKRATLRDHSILKLNHRLIEAHPNTWTEQDIDGRGELMTEVLVNRWPHAETLAVGTGSGARLVSHSL